MESVKSQRGQKHHYIPKFYLKQWCNSSGLLCEFSRPHTIVKPRMTSPDGTGYVRGLNTFETLPHEAANFLETQFFLLLKADNLAAAAMRELLQGNVALSQEMRNGWTRFIMTLLHRTPEGFARITERITKDLPVQIERFIRTNDDLLGLSHDAPALAELSSLIGDERALENLLLRVLHSNMDSERVGNVLNQMHWTLLTINHSDFSLLTSHRPMTMTLPIGHPNARLFIPVSPNDIFVAANQPDVPREMNDIVPSRIVRWLNDRVARQSRKYVYAADDRQLRFVPKRLGQKARWSPLE